MTEKMYSTVNPSITIYKSGVQGVLHYTDLFLKRKFFEVVPLGSEHFA